MKYIPLAVLLSAAVPATAQTTIADTPAISTIAPLADSLQAAEDEDENELQAVTISTTRSTRSIRDIPTRVEFIGGEELEEKANMKPGDIRMVLAESTGIQTQQTSATSANASIRIQGLDGRYTQILKDGLPIYSGAAAGLGLLQTPPLDLKQVEVVKGSASTLYGGGAIAGLVNLISKTPGPERELRFIANGTSAGGLDLSGFYGQRFGKWGTTVYAARNSNAPYDPAGIDLTAVPKFTRYTANPKLFYYPSRRTTLVAGLNFSTEDRVGGCLHTIRGEADPDGGYVETNSTQRISTELSATHAFDAQHTLTFKNSYSHFNRRLTTPGYVFEGLQQTSYTEAAWNRNGERSDWVAGVNVLYDRFDDARNAQIPQTFSLSYQQNTFGAFAQNTFNATEKLVVETGLRGDYVRDYGAVLLPRVSLLYKFSRALSSRIGGGAGYKTPTPFTEESERILYQGLLGIHPASNVLERSYGLNGDVNYRTRIGAVSVSLNQLFFYTFINRPLQLVQNSNSTTPYSLRNIKGHFDTRGTETNIKLGYEDFKLFLGYTYTDAQLHPDNAAPRENLLTPKHRVNAVLMYEVENRWKLGLEAYYFSPQQLSDGATGRDYWITGFMAERLWERFSLYINFENFLDARQTRFDTIYTGSRQNPQFRDIYAPLDGFVVNGGLKLKL